MMGTDGDVLVQIKNASSLLALSDCDRGIAPTTWQRSTFPKEYLDRIDVVHEGVDVDIVKPNRDASFQLTDGKTLTRDDEVLTYVTRNLEPLRGCHIFLRSLPRILKERPNAQVLIVGGDGTSYGAQPPRGKTWKSIFFDEVKDKLDLSRVHFTGVLPYDQYLSVLQISSAHVYLTYPFVTSWSLVEALSAGCLVIGSDTSPVRELIDGSNGFLVPFFDIDGLSKQVIEVLAGGPHLDAIRAKARQSTVERYDKARICVPKLMSLLTGRPLETIQIPARLAEDPKSVTRVSKKGPTRGSDKKLARQPRHE
jgi:glycosyltransferase involved in cell wall biosynthesis